MKIITLVKALDKLIEKQEKLRKKYPDVRLSQSIGSLKSLRKDLDKDLSSSKILQTKPLKEKNSYVRLSQKGEALCTNIGSNIYDINKEMDGLLKNESS